MSTIKFNTAKGAAIEVTVGESVTLLANGNALRFFGAMNGNLLANQGNVVIPVPADVAESLAAALAARDKLREEAINNSIAKDRKYEDTNRAIARGF